MLQSENKECLLTLTDKGDIVIQKQDPDRAEGGQCSKMKRCEYVWIPVTPLLMTVTSLHPLISHYGTYMLTYVYLHG